jgi:hypothetical protein
MITSPTERRVVVARGEDARVDQAVGKSA